MPKTHPHAPANLDALRHALANVHQLRAKVADLRATIDAEKQELQRLSETASADDRAAIQRMSELQARAALLPGNLLTAQAEAFGAIAELERTGDIVLAQLKSLTDAEIDALAAEVIGLLRPYAPPFTDPSNGQTHDPARNFAYSVPKAGAIRNNGTPQGTWPQTTRGSHNAESFDKSTIHFAEEILRVAEYRAAHGTSLPANWPHA